MSSTTYRCYFTNSEDHFVAVQVIEEFHDTAALQRAGELLAKCDHFAVELWERSRMIGTRVKDSWSPTPKKKPRQLPSGV